MQGWALKWWRRSKHSAHIYGVSVMSRQSAEKFISLPPLLTALYLCHPGFHLIQLSDRSFYVGFYLLPTYFHMVVSGLFTCNLNVTFGFEPFYDIFLLPSE